MIFRDQALRRYYERNERQVFPKLSLPRIPFALWTLFSLLVSALIIASLTKVPAYARGAAIEIERGSGPIGPIRLLAVLPTESLWDLRLGQKVFIRWNERKGMVRGEVSEIIPSLLTAADIKSRFNLNVESSAQPKTVALISVVEGESEEVAQLSHERSDRFLEVQIEVGSRRLVSLIH